MGNMLVFLTSRFNVDASHEIHHAIRVAVSATVHDITPYVLSKIHENTKLARFTTRDPDLERHIVDRIVTQADGIFLLPGLQVGSLDNQTSVKGVRFVLERLPTDIFTCMIRLFREYVTSRKRMQS